MPIERQIDQAELKRRRRWLAISASAAAVVFAVIAVVVVGGRGGDDKPTPKKAPVATIPVAKFVLKPVANAATSKKGGVAEVVRQDDKLSMRVIATGLQPSTKTVAYGVVLTGGGNAAERLGQAVTDRRGTLLGSTPITIKELNDYKFVSVYRQALGQRSGELGKLVLRGRLPTT